MGVDEEEVLEGGIGYVVVDSLAVEGNPRICAGANEAVLALVGFVGQRGACAQKSQAFANVLQELLRGETAAGVVSLATQAMPGPRLRSMETVGMPLGMRRLGS